MMTSFDVKSTTRQNRIGFRTASDQLAAPGQSPGLTWIIVAPPVAPVLAQAQSDVPKETEGNRRKPKMDKDRIAGSAKVVAGKAKVAVGKLVGDAKLQADGQAEKIAGTAQNTIGGIKDALQKKQAPRRPAV